MNTINLLNLLFEHKEKYASLKKFFNKHIDKLLAQKKTNNIFMCYIQYKKT